MLYKWSPPSSMQTKSSSQFPKLFLLSPPRVILIGPLHHRRPVLICEWYLTLALFYWVRHVILSLVSLQKAILCSWVWEISTGGSDSIHKICTLGWFIGDLKLTWLIFQIISCVPVLTPLRCCNVCRKLVDGGALEILYIQYLAILRVILQVIVVTFGILKSWIAVCCFHSPCP